MARGGRDTSAAVARPEAIRGRAWDAIRAILDGELAWTRVAELPGGWRSAHALAEGGWAEIWRVAKGYRATLTPWAAVALGVVLGEETRTSWRIDRGKEYDPATGEDRMTAISLRETVERRAGTASDASPRG